MIASQEVLTLSHGAFSFSLEDRVSSKLLDRLLVDANLGAVRLLEALFASKWLTLLLVALVIVSLRLRAERDVVGLLLRRGALIIRLIFGHSHIAGRVQGADACVTISVLFKDDLNILDSLLLLKVGLSQTFEYALFLLLKSTCLSVLLADFNDLALDDLLFELTDCDPLTRHDLLGFLLGTVGLTSYL